MADLEAELDGSCFPRPAVSDCAVPSCGFSSDFIRLKCLADDVSALHTGLPVKISRLFRPAPSMPHIRTLPWQQIGICAQAEWSRRMLQ